MAVQSAVLKTTSVLCDSGPQVSFVLNGECRASRFTSDAAALPFEACRPVRAFTSWPGKRNYSGSYAAHTTGTHIGFESLYERTALLTLDRDPSVVGISSQPMWIHWKHEGKTKAHAPDYFVRHSNGDGEIIDVRPASLIDDTSAEIFEATSRMSAAVGLKYRVISDLTPPLEQNLKFLCRYAGPGWECGTAQRAIIDAQCRPISIRRLAQTTCQTGGLGLAAVYSAIWHGLINVNLERALGLDSLVTRADRSVT